MSGLSDPCLLGIIGHGFNHCGKARPWPVGIDRFIDGKEMSHSFAGGLPEGLLRLHGARNGAIRVLLIRG